jgi:hypothetical protein
VLIVASRASGIGAARSAICWDALQAAATECPVAVIYIAPSKAAAAFVVEWDSWERSGITTIPLYVSEGLVAGEGSVFNGASNGTLSMGSLDDGEVGELLPQQDRCDT